MTLTFTLTPPSFTTFCPRGCSSVNFQSHRVDAQACRWSSQVWMGLWERQMRTIYHWTLTDQTASQGGPTNQAVCTGGPAGVHWADKWNLPECQEWRLEQGWGTGWQGVNELSAGGAAARVWGPVTRHKAVPMETERSQIYDVFVCLRAGRVAARLHGALWRHRLVFPLWLRDFCLEEQLCWRISQSQFLGQKQQVKGQHHWVCWPATPTSAMVVLKWGTRWGTTSLPFEVLKGTFLGRRVLVIIVIRV